MASLCGRNTEKRSVALKKHKTRAVHMVSPVREPQFLRTPASPAEAGTHDQSPQEFQFIKYTSEEEPVQERMKPQECSHLPLSPFISKQGLPLDQLPKHLISHEDVSTLAMPPPHPDTSRRDLACLGPQLALSSLPVAFVGGSEELDFGSHVKTCTFIDVCSS